jgi:hypothetical protein
MRKTYLGLAVLILSASVLIGCETQRQQVLNDNWGKSYQAVKTNHIINPDAGMDDQTVDGMNGVNSEKAMEKHHKSFEEKPPAQVTNINISGIGLK